MRTRHDDPSEFPDDRHFVRAPQVAGYDVGRGFLQRSWGAAVLILLSIGLLLFGGGIFPPLMGVVGVVGTKINTPLKRESGAFWRVLAKACPWTIILLFGGLFGQFVIAYFFKDFLMEYGAFLLFLPVLLLVSILTGYGHDLQNPTGA